MIPLVVLTGTALGGPLSLARVELLSLDPGTFVGQELPLAGVRPGTTTARWLQQVQPVLRLGDGPLALGLSVASQSVSWDEPLGPFVLSAGVQTRLALPVGVFGGLSRDLGPVRLGVGGSYRSLATWAYLDGYRDWVLSPGVELAWLFRDRAP